MKITRRSFIQIAGAASLAAFIPITNAPDEYDQFMQRVRDRVVKLVRREGLAPEEIVIDPPHVVGGETFRLARVRLVGIRQPITFSERYDVR